MIDTIKLVLLSFCFLATVGSNAQDPYEEAENKLRETFCECLTNYLQELEAHGVEFKIEEGMFTCYERLEKHIRPLFEKVPDGKSAEEHEEFLLRVPKVLGATISESCYSVCVYLQKQQKSEEWLNISKDMFSPAQRLLIYSDEIYLCLSKSLMSVSCTYSNPNNPDERGPLLELWQLKQNCMNPQYPLYLDSLKQNNVLKEELMKRLVLEEQLSQADSQVFSACFLKKLEEANWDSKELVLELSKTESKIDDYFLECLQKTEH